MNRTVVGLFCLLFSSCSLFSEFRKRSFEPRGDDAFQLLVPKKWSRSSLERDSIGGNVRVFHYPDGAAFYVTDTGLPFVAGERIDTSMHLPLAAPGGGTMYKGVMPGLLYWREIQRGRYRMGYRNVTTEWETRFDSALNFAAQMRPLR